MTTQPAIAHDELARILLLRGLDHAELDALLALCEPAPVTAGVLFEAGSPADAFYLLTSGSVSLVQDGEEMHKLHPAVLIGELGALTGRVRTTTALVGEGYEVWQIRVAALRELFEREPRLAMRFMQNLLEVAADKIQRDQVRLQDMRSNIIHTQKDMKRMREFLLESKETEISAQIHEVLEDNIARNRRVNYRVEPPVALTSYIRLDDRTQAPVVQISRTLATVAGRLGARGDRVSGVLYLNGPEIPVSGRVSEADDDTTEIQLDLLLDEYAAELEGYLTRVQMLDYLV